MKLFFHSALIFYYSLALSGMMQSGDGVSALPWSRSSFHARYKPPVSNAAVKTNQTEHLLTVVFDMDETILWQRHQGLNEPVYRYGIQELLSHLRRLERIRMILWTAAQRDFVDDILKPFFHQIITRDDGNWFQIYRGTKPLRILSDVHPDRVVMFDDRSHSIQEDQHRALLVHAFHGPFGLEHEPEVDSNDLTHKHIRELVGYLLSQIEDGKTVPQALMTYASTPGVLEWHECPTLKRPFLRVQRGTSTGVPFFVRVDSFADGEGEAFE